MPGTLQTSEKHCSYTKLTIFWTGHAALRPCASRYEKELPLSAMVPTVEYLLADGLGKLSYLILYSCSCPNQKATGMSAPDGRGLQNGVAVFWFPGPVCPDQHPDPGVPDGISAGTVSDSPVPKIKPPAPVAPPMQLATMPQCPRFSACSWMMYD